MNMKQRSYKKELLDDDNIPFSDIRDTMKELDVINDLLGGHNITRLGVAFFLDKLPAGRPLVIAEIGCGGGDNLTAIYNYMQKRGRAVQLIGVDIKPECLAFAKQQVEQDVTWICSDYRTTPWPGGNKPDIIFSSLFCHHFTDEQMTTQLQWLRANSNAGFFINDLHRHPVAYYSIKLLTRFFSRSYLVKNDGPLSVLRSFRRADWQRLMMASGIGHYRISWHWAFRYLVCYSHE